MSRGDVRDKLAELGVDATDIEGRLAALSDQEIARLAGQIGRLPRAAMRSP